ncbi:MAG: prepilin peptidase [Planctomycetaceae bacterium]
MNLQTIEYLFTLTWLFLLGAVIGSLLNVCIYRLPLDERFWPALKGLWYPPSHCPRCDARIAPYDNIPIFGWLWLRGRCRNCRARISFRYPSVELLTATLFVVVYWFEIPDWWAGAKASCLYHEFGPPGIATGPNSFLLLHLRYALHMTLIVALIVATFIDIDLRIIPDTVTLPAMGLAIVAHTILGQAYIVPVWYQTPQMHAAIPTDIRLFLNGLTPPPQLPQWFGAWLNFSGVPGWVAAYPHWQGLLLSLAGLVVGGGIVWGVRLVGHWVLRREAMGFGDVVLLAMIGSFLGWQPALIVFFLAPLCALTCTAAGWLIWRDREIPYGPYLSLAALLLTLLWRPLWPWLETRVFTLGPLLPVAGVVMLVALGGLLYVTRTIQKVLGITPAAVDEEWVVEWTSADQLSYQAGERVDEQQGQWRREDWPGRFSGRGLLNERNWRRD